LSFFLLYVSPIPGTHARVSSLIRFLPFLPYMFSTAEKFTAISYLPMMACFSSSPSLYRQYHLSLFFYPLFSRGFFTQGSYVSLGHPLGIFFRVLRAVLCDLMSFRPPHNPLVFFLLTSLPIPISKQEMWNTFSLEAGPAGDPPSLFCSKRLWHSRHFQPVGVAVSFRLEMFSLVLFFSCLFPPPAAPSVSPNLFPLLTPLKKRLLDFGMRPHTLDVQGIPIYILPSCTAPRTTRSSPPPWLRAYFSTPFDSLALESPNTLF